MKRVFVDLNFKYWILDGIIRESIDASPHEPILIYISTRKFSIQMMQYFLLKKKIEFNVGDLIVNQGTLFSLISQGRIDRNTLHNLNCYFTHDSKWNLVNNLDILTQLNLILVMNLQDKRLLINIGVRSDKIRIVYGAINPNIYFPSKQLPNTEPYIYISGDAKGRKNPGKIVELIESSPEFKFIISGRFWIDYLKKNRRRLSNAKICDFNLKKNPDLMRNAFCYLSLSLHEGGPYPVLEALASGTPVVATPTGWIPELISEKNGFIVGFDIPISDLKLVLRKALDLKKLVFDSDLTNGVFTWEKLATLLYED